MKINKHVLLLLALYALICCGCEQHRIRNYVINCFDGETEKDSVVILDLPGIIGINYTDFYIFCGMHTQQDISEIANRPYVGHTFFDGSYRFVFFHGDKTVYEETFQWEQIDINIGDSNTTEPCHGIIASSKNNKIRFTPLYKDL